MEKQNYSEISINENNDSSEIIKTGIPKFKYGSEMISLQQRTQGAHKMLHTVNTVHIRNVKAFEI